MEHLKETGQVRLKVGVVNHLKIPKWTQLATPKLHYYRIYFQLEEIVELGWDRDESDLLQDFEDVMDSQTEEADARDPKRQKGNSPTAASSPSGLLLPAEKNILASTKTRLALEQREQNLKEQDEEDARINMHRYGKEKELPRRDMQEKTGENAVENDDSEKQVEERVRLTDDETEGDFDASQSDSFGDKVKAYGGTSQELPRCSSRLASKNSEDTNMLEKAKNYKANNIDIDEGVGCRKSGAANGRKAAGASRG